MIETEVVIVGGGISGNYLAYLLRKDNVPCVVIEKHGSFLARPLQCAGILSQKIRSLVHFPSSIILNRVSKVKLIEPFGDALTIEGNEHPVIIDRLQFDAHFGEFARSEGAIYKFNESYLWHRKTRDTRVLVKTTKNRYLCRYLIGADGPGSRVRKQFHHTVPFISAAQVRAHFRYPLHQTTMIFNPQWRELFGYIVPEGSNGIARIGLAAAHNPGKCLRKFLTSLHVQDADIITHQGGLIPFGYPKRLVFDRTALLGDAGGMVKATTGGGIIMSISAAKILAKALISAHRTHNYSYKHMKGQYERKFQFSLGVQLKIHFLIRQFLMDMEPKEFHILFQLINRPSIQKILQTEADMDFPLHMMVKLVQNKNFIAFAGKMLIHHPQFLLILPKVFVGR